MGEVYEAYEESLNRKVAIKILATAPPDSGRSNEDIISRFIQEARTLAQIHHPNVVSIFAVNQFEHLNYIVMELVEGMSLREFLDRYVLSGDEAGPLFLRRCNW